jgi:hypothetical protein
VTLTNEQVAALRAAAAAEGVDADALVAAAQGEAGTDVTVADNPVTPDGDPIKLFQYHLPFIRVRELRSRWLGLDESLQDDEMVCGQWLEKHGGIMATSKSGRPSDGGEPPASEE